MSTRLLVHGDWRDLLACCRLQRFEALSCLQREGEEGRDGGVENPEIKARVFLLRPSNTRVGPGPPSAL